MDDPVNITEAEANVIALRQEIAEGNEAETIIRHDIKFMNYSKIKFQYLRKHYW